MSTCDTAVAFITFNRPDTTAQAFACIRSAAPRRLYHISDAARDGDAREEALVEECRRIVTEGIDWPCELHTIYAKENMGCKKRVYSGITEVLSRESAAIILEDDILPAPEFFPYCEALLKLYAEDERVMMISGINLVREYPLREAYTFSCFSGIWGWATWARAWKLYDPDVRSWPEVKRSGRLRGIYGWKRYFFLKRDIRSVYTGRKDTWDIQWDYARNIHHALGIVPRENMIRNIGFGREDATHTKHTSTEDFSYGKLPMQLPQRLPVKRDLAYDRAYLKKYFGLRKLTDFVKKKLGWMS